MGSANSQQLKWLLPGWLSVYWTPAIWMYAVYPETEIAPPDSVRFGSDRSDYRRSRIEGMIMCACCCCIFFNRFLSDPIAYLVCGAWTPNRPTRNRRPQTGLVFSLFLAFSRPLSWNVSTMKEICRKNKTYSFSPIRLTFSPRKTCFGYQLHLLNTQRQPQFRMPYGTHLFSRVRFTTGP